MGAMGDMSKSERALMCVIYMVGLLALLLVPGVERWKVELWGYGAGGLAAVYVGFKSLKPNDTPKAAPAPVAPLVPGDDR